MRFVAIFVSIFFIVFAAPGTGAGVSPAAAQVRVNELLADPGVDWDGDGLVGAKADEWVEVVNTGAVPVDLSCYRLGDLSGGTTWRYGFSVTLAPGAVHVVYGSDAVAWEAANGFPTVGLSLNNGGDTVFLYDVGSGDTLVADQAPYAGFQVLNDRSTGRSPDGADNWVIFDALNPYPGVTPPLGTGCAPSPGGLNLCVPTVPVEQSTWGTIKALYRN